MVRCFGAWVRKSRVLGPSIAAFLSLVLFSSCGIRNTKTFSGKSLVESTEATSEAEPDTGGEIITIENLGITSTVELASKIPSFFEHFTAPDPIFDVEKFSVRFTSKDFDGSPVEIVGQLFIPHSDGEYPLYVFASGTTGIGDLCAPSLEMPEVRRWGWYEQNMFAYASQGFVVFFPDYTGFHDPARPQRYFSKLVEGRMMLDAVRAVKSFFSDTETNAGLSGEVFTAGYSQGGHAAMAAADLRSEYAPEIELTGIITFGSTNDVESLVREGPAYAPLIFYSYQSMYGTEEIRPAEYLKERWMPTFETDASTMAVDEFQLHYGFDYRPLYTEAFSKSLYGGNLGRDYPSLAARLAENHTGLSGHDFPVFVVQGEKDFIVTPDTQKKFVDALRELGSAVEYRVYPGVSHRYTRMAGFHDSITWMREQINKGSDP